MLERTKKHCGSCFSFDFQISFFLQELHRGLFSMQCMVLCPLCVLSNARMHMFFHTAVIKRGPPPWGSP